MLAWEAELAHQARRASRNASASETALLLQHKKKELAPSVSGTKKTVVVVASPSAFKVVVVFSGVGAEEGTGVGAAIGAAVGASVGAGLGAWKMVVVVSTVVLVSFS